MATNSRFVELSENDIDEFCEQQENDNTTQKPLYDISIFKEFIPAYYSTEYREIEDISPSDLQPILMKFVLAVRKKDGKTVNARIVNRTFTAVQKYGFYVLVSKTISFLPLEHKIHIFSQPCNILYVFAQRMRLFSARLSVVKKSNLTTLGMLSTFLF